MPQTFKVKNSSVEGKAPAAGDLATAELALNLKDQKLFSKDADGTVFEIGADSPEALEFLTDTNIQSVLAGQVLMFEGSYRLDGPIKGQAGFEGNLYYKLPDGTSRSIGQKVIHEIIKVLELREFNGDWGHRIEFLREDGTTMFINAQVDEDPEVAKNAVYYLGGTGLVAEETATLGKWVNADASFVKLDDEGITQSIVGGGGLDVAGGITSEFGTNTDQLGNVAPLNDWSCYPARSTVFYSQPAPPAPPAPQPEPVDPDFGVNEPTFSGDIVSGGFVGTQDIVDLEGE